MNATALACRDCARGLLRIAREAKQDGNTAAVARLVNSARFYWRWYLTETRH